MTALILYHIHSSLSSTFWKYFLFSFYLIFFRLRCNFYIISHRFVFVKYFFKTFWSFLSSWFLSLKTQLLYYITSFWLCQVLFQTFWSFLYSSPSFEVSLAGSFIILPLLKHFVNTFSDIFWNMWNLPCFFQYSAFILANISICIHTYKRKRIPKRICALFLKWTALPPCAA